MKTAETLFEEINLAADGMDIEDVAKALAAVLAHMTADIAAYDQRDAVQGARFFGRDLVNATREICRQHRRTSSH